MKRKVILSLGLLILLSSILAWWALPRLINALPGQYRLYVPPSLLEMVTTPLPTALPIPDVTVSPPALIVFASSTPVPIPPTFTPQPSATHLPQETAVTLPNAMPLPTTSPTPSAIPSPTPTPLPTTVRIDGLEIIPQKFNNCGPTNLAITLNFYGHQTDQLDIAAILKPNYEDRNVTPQELSDYVNRQTPLKATYYSGGDLTLLKTLLAAGFPVIIEKGLEQGEWQGWMGHYLTLFGYDDSQQLFYSMDTFLGPWDSSGRTDSYEHIQTHWQQFNYTFIIVYPPTRETAVQQIVGPTLIEPITMWQQATLTAQTELETDAKNAYAWFNLGTSLTRLAEVTGQTTYYSQAAAAFDQARALGLPARMLWYQFRPYVAYLADGRFQDVLTLAEATLISQGGRQVEETYLYQGHAFVALGDIEKATAAYQQAIQLNENFTQAQQAFAALSLQD